MFCIQSCVPVISNIQCVVRTLSSKNIVGELEMFYLGICACHLRHTAAKKPACMALWSGICPTKKAFASAKSSSRNHMT